jgi:hypothetical protein
MNDDTHFAYNVLAQALCDRPYIQHEHWGTRRGFKLDPILGTPEFIIDGLPNQIQTGDEGITIPGVSAAL